MTTTTTIGLLVVMQEWNGEKENPKSTHGYHFWESRVRLGAEYSFLLLFYHTYILFLSK